MIFVEMKIEYTENNTKIVDSYKYNNKEINHGVKVIISTRRKLGLPVTRTEKSYIAEWKTHNRLYKLGIEKERTKDADLEENINPVRDFLYSIMGF